MTVNDIAQQLLGYFSPEERSIPDAVAYPGRNAAVAKAMNHALQNLFGKGKPWVRKDERGAVLRGPTQVTVEVTNGDTTANITGWESWMAGCTIVIEGMAVDNQIRDGITPSRLQFPYSGTTGTKSATIYQNSITIDVDVTDVQGPVFIDGVPMSPMPEANSRMRTGQAEDFAFRDNLTAIAKGAAESVGLPAYYAIDTWSPDMSSPSRLRMRLYPAPGTQHFVAYSVTLSPMLVSDLASPSTLPIPFDKVQSIFMPMAVDALRQCPFWRGIAGEDVVAAAKQDAIDELKASDPSTHAPRFFTKF